MIVVTILRHRGRVLLTRSAGPWDAPRIGRRGGESPETAARRVARDVLDTAVTVVRSSSTRGDDGGAGRAVLLEPAARLDAVSGVLTPDFDDGESEWVHPPAILRCDTVSGLWRAYERVAPTLRTVVADDEHGSTWLSVRALEVLRDRAGLLSARGDDGADPAELVDLADRLQRTRPGMAAVRNRIDRAMADATEWTAPAVERAAVDGVDRAVDADREAAARAAEQLPDSVLTLSRSGTVLRALRAADVETVYVAESRPGREGVDTAETLARSGRRVVVHTDAAVGTVLAERADAVLVGADAVRADGAVVNKTGTRTAATAAAGEGVPVYVVAASDKVATGPVRVEADASDLYDGGARVETYDPVFDVTPPDLVDGLVTERGRLSTDEVATLADDLAALADWPASDAADPD